MENYKTVSVTGTHGKTTTTSMIAWIFEKAGLDPTVITGGIVNDWGTNARIGAGEWFIVEADESDETFVKLPTQIGVVTNIDPEHLDFYGSVEAMYDAYRRFFAGIRPGGAVVAGIDHPVVRDFAGATRNQGGRVLGYGVAQDAEIRLASVKANGAAMHLEAIIASAVKGGERRFGNLTLAVPGHYNALNAMAAIAAATEAGIPDEAIRDALATFHGVKRRFTRTGIWNGVAIYDDYAHHPVEIAATLGAARGATGGRVIAIVQPHRYSRLRNLFEDFCGCFGDSDTVIVTPVYSAGEEPNGVDRDSLIEGVRQRGHRQVLPVDGEDQLAGLVASLAKPGDLVIGLGAGTISDWANALPARLDAMQPRLDAAE
jgi:UDP-N-acetylmuramate--alanine ligase